MLHLLKPAMGALILSAGAASAATLSIDGNGQLTGARDVTVDGMTYDVSFREGSCIDLFSGCDVSSDFNFPNSGLANAAGQALLDQVFLDQGAGQEFDSKPELTFGCASSSLCLALIPYGTGPGTATLATAQNYPTSSSDLASAVLFDRDYDTTDDELSVYADFSEVAAVPLPAGLPLLVAGLGLLGLMRRRSKAV